jgi:hypothetical protein
MILKRVILTDFKRPFYRNHILDVDDLRNEILRLNTKHQPILGEIMDASYSGDLTVTLSNVSHRIFDIVFDKDIIYGNIELLDTPRGKQVQHLLTNGMEVDYSIRATCSRSADGVDKINMYTWDIVLPTF